MIKDLWVSERQAKVGLPFQCLGKPLEASFQVGLYGGEKYAEIKKAAGIGCYIGGFFSDDSSSVIADGGR